MYTMTANEYDLRIAGRRGPGAARRPVCEGAKLKLLVCLQPDHPPPSMAMAECLVVVVVGTHPPNSYGQKIPRGRTGMLRVEYLPSTKTGVASVKTTWTSGCTFLDVGIEYSIAHRRSIAEHQYHASRITHHTHITCNGGISCEHKAHITQI